MLAELFPTPTRNTAMVTIFNGSRVLMFVPAGVVAGFAAEKRFALGIALAAAFSAAAAGFIWLLPETRGQKLAA